MYDIVIIGNGIVSLVHALALTQQTNLKIAIVTQQNASKLWSPSDYDPRVYALVRQSQLILADLGIWSNLSKQRVSVIKDMRIWDYGSAANLKILHQELNVSALAYVVEENLLYNCLLRALKQFNQISWFMAWHFINFWQHPEYLLVNCTEGVLKTKLLLGADGGESLVRQAAQLPFTQNSYQQSSFITQVVTELPHHNCAQQFFINTAQHQYNGPLAFLPLQDPHLAAVVWSMSPQDAQTIMALPDLALAQTLSQASLEQFGAIQIKGVRQVFPLYERHAGKYVVERIALLGDAAHTIHPLAGQGLNLGIADAASLAAAIIRAWGKGRKFYTHQNLRYYERDRKPKNFFMVKTIWWLKQLFSSRNQLTIGMRKSGLAWLKYFPLLQQLIVRYAMGK